MVEQVWKQEKIETQFCAKSGIIHVRPKESALRVARTRPNPVNHVARNVTHITENDHTTRGCLTLDVNARKRGFARYAENLQEKAR